MKNFIFVSLVVITLTACNGSVEESLVQNTYEQNSEVSYEFSYDDSVDYQKGDYYSQPYGIDTQGLAQWYMPLEVKNAFMQEKNCESLKGAYLPVYLDRAYKCEVIEKDGFDVVYIIGSGFEYERSAYLMDVMIVLDEKNLHIFSNVLPDLNKEFAEISSKVFAEQEASDFGSPGWFAANEQLISEIPEVLKSDFIVEQFELLKKIANSMQVDEFSNSTNGSVDVVEIISRNQQNEELLDENAFGFRKHLVDGISGYYMAYPEKYADVEVLFMEDKLIYEIRKMEDAESDRSDGEFYTRIFFSVEENPNNLSALEWANENTEAIGFTEKNMQNQYVQSEYETVNVNGLEGIKFETFSMGFLKYYVLKAEKLILKIGLYVQDGEDEIMEDFDNIVSTLRKLPEGYILN